MPHIVVDHLDLPTLPATLEEMTFEFATTGERGVVAARRGEYRFLLRFAPHAKGVLIKADKTTRIPKLSEIKRAMKALAALTEATIVTSTIESTRQEREYPNLKTPGFFAGEYGYTRPLWVEIGFGSGRHLLHQAKTHPEVDLIGIEIHKPSLEQTLGQCHLQELSNIFILDADARLVMQTLESNSVQRIFLHFPVPWEKSPGRRIISKSFIDEAIRVLQPQGTLELRTDSDFYFNYAFETVLSLTQLHAAIAKNADIAITSKYEDRWRRLRKDIFDLTLTNYEHSPLLERDISFAFDQAPSLSRFEALAAQGTFLYETFLIRIQETMPISDEEGLVKLTMGPKGKPQQRYILVRNGQISYYPEPPIATGENRQAHETLKELING